MLKGRAPPHAHQPLAVDGGINGDAHPKQSGQVRVGFGDLTEGLVGNHADRAGHDRHDSMIHLFHQGAVEVHEVAGHMKGRDLALPIAQDVVAHGKARDEDDTLGWAVTLADETVILLHRSLPDDSPLKNLSFRVGETVVLLKLADEGETQDRPSCCTMVAVAQQLSRIVSRRRIRAQSCLCLPFEQVP
jgi:hypothetical protein